MIYSGTNYALFFIYFMTFQWFVKNIVWKNNIAANKLTATILSVVDLRRQPCFLSSSSGFCTNEMSQPTKRDQCCCSIGVAWGSDCEACPRQSARKLL